MSPPIVDLSIVPTIDRLTFNLLAEDIGTEFNNAITCLDSRLTVGGVVCGPKKTTYKDFSSPVIFELEMREGRVVYASTKLLITRDNGYSYCFFAGGGWKACDDCRNHYIVQGSEEVWFSSAYVRSMNKSKIGPGRIASAIFSLFGTNGEYWRESFLILCFIFIESLRCTEFGDYVRDTLVHGAESYQIYTYTQLAPPKLLRLPNYWGQASNALRDFFLSPQPNTVWTVSSDVLKAFESTTEYEAECANAAAIVDADERKWAKIRADVNFLLSKVRMVMHG